MIPNCDSHRQGYKIRPAVQQVSNWQMVVRCTWADKISRILFGISYRRVFVATLWKYNVRWPRKVDGQNESDMWHHMILSRHIYNLTGTLAKRIIRVASEDLAQSTMWHMQWLHFSSAVWAGSGSNLLRHCNRRFSSRVCFENRSKTDNVRII
jgi:hypothetical protein